jgi:hypothetical protein
VQEFRSFDGLRIAYQELPTLVAIGDADDTRATADQLAAELPDSRFVRLPGNHWTAFTAPEFGVAVVDWLRNVSEM